jgi:hypothetical protein
MITLRATRASPATRCILLRLTLFFFCCKLMFCNLFVPGGWRHRILQRVRCARWLHNEKNDPKCKCAKDRRPNPKSRQGHQPRWSAPIAPHPPAKTTNSEAPNPQGSSLKTNPITTETESGTFLFGAWRTSLDLHHKTLSNDDRNEQLAGVVPEPASAAQALRSAQCLHNDVSHVKSFAQIAASPQICNP